MITKLTLVSLFTLGTSLAVPIYNPANGHYYDVVDTPLTWDDARAQAEATVHLGQNGYLATITSQEENDFLVQAFPQITVGLNQGGYLLGGYQADTSGGPADGWAWVTGEAWDYTNWLPGGEPNDFGNNPENYLMTHDYIGSNPNAYWNDGGNFGRGYLVEFNASPVPDAGATAILFGLGIAALSTVQRK